MQRETEVLIAAEGDFLLASKTLHMDALDLRLKVLQDEEAPRLLKNMLMFSLVELVGNLQGRLNERIDDMSVSEMSTLYLKTLDTVGKMAAEQVPTIDARSITNNTGPITNNVSPRDIMEDKLAKLRLVTPLNHNSFQANEDAEDA